jgi:membrane protein YdbS with pleckstrin-like domain
MADPVDDTAKTDAPPDPPDERAATAADPDGADEPQDDKRPPAERHTTERRTLSPSVQLLWAVRAVVGVAVLGVVGGFAVRQTRFDPRIVPVVVVALGVLGLIWVHLRYRVWSFRVREDALYLERGVITNVKTVAPHVRIQHVDTARGPLERALGLSTLVVYTAGSRGADVSIPGLTTEEAADLQTRVKELAITADGADAL